MEKCFIFTQLQYNKQQIKNILSDFIEVTPGQKVVIKPNWVREGHTEKPDEWDYIITHPTLIEAAAEIVVEKLNGNGELKIMDSPMSNSSFRKIVERDNIRQKLLRLNSSGVKVSVLDLRQIRDYMKGDILVSSRTLPGDPMGFFKINLREDSLFHSRQNRQYFGADYDVKQLRELHNERDNIYFLSRSILEADVVINMPKLKSHRLAGMTGALKNMVGITVMKNSIPHYTIGTPDNGGDDYRQKNLWSAFEMKTLGIMRNIWKKKNPAVNSLFIPARKLYAALADKPEKPRIRGGIWYGNDTVWRAVLDLNRIVLYADKNGVMQNTPQRTFLTITDAIHAGENYGPLKPDRKVCGTIIIGKNPVAADTAACFLMGYDYQKIPVVREAYLLKKYPLISSSSPDITIVSSEKRFDNLQNIFWDNSFQFVPPFGWKNHIERRR